MEVPGLKNASAAYKTTVPLLTAPQSSCLDKHACFILKKHLVLFFCMFYLLSYKFYFLLSSLLFKLRVYILCVEKIDDVKKSLNDGSFASSISSNAGTSSLQRSSLDVSQSLQAVEMFSSFVEVSQIMFIENFFIYLYSLLLF